MATHTAVKGDVNTHTVNNNGRLETGKHGAQIPSGNSQTSLRFWILDITDNTWLVILNYHTHKINRPCLQHPKMTLNSSRLKRKLLTDWNWIKKRFPSLRLLWTSRWKRAYPHIFQQRRVPFMLRVFLTAHI